MGENPIKRAFVFTLWLSKLILPLQNVDTNEALMIAVTVTLYKLFK